jgi:hypothetical protein
MRTDVASSLKNITTSNAAAKPQKFLALSVGFIKSSLPNVWASVQLKPGDSNIPDKHVRFMSFRPNILTGLPQLKLT